MRTACSAAANEVWTASKRLRACPGEVLEALTDPSLIAAWAPVGFEVERIEDDRLVTGTHARVRGSLGGVGAVFDVEVLHAGADGLSLLARGPVELEVSYTLLDDEDDVLVDVEVCVERRHGLTSRILRAATSALLAGGALDHALGRLGSLVTDSDERELAVA